jgi:hypothetical protein
LGVTTSTDDVVVNRVWLYGSVALAALRPGSRRLAGAGPVAVRYAEYGTPQPT